MRAKDKWVAAAILLGFVLVTVWVTVNVRAEDARFQREKQDALQALADGRYQEAVEKLGKLRSTPEVQAALDRAKKLLASEEALAEAREAEAAKKWERAYEAYGQVCPEHPAYQQSQAKMVELVPTIGDQLLAEAKARVAAREYGEALILLRRIVNNYPTYKQVDAAKSLLARTEETYAKVQAEAARAEASKKMKEYESDRGPIGIAVMGIRLQTAFDAGYSTYTLKDKDWRFVLVAVAAANMGISTSHVNPNHFTLSSPDGYAARHDNLTYSLSNYFEAVDLPPGKYTTGWLVFVMPLAEEYTLHFRSLDGQATKRIVR